MTDNLVKRLRLIGEKRLQCTACYKFIETADEAADRIEKLVEENGALFAANVRLNSRADLDSDGYVDRIEKLEESLREVAEAVGDSSAYWIARKALEGTNGP